MLGLERNHGVRTPLRMYHLSCSSLCSILSLCFRLPPLFFKPFSYLTEGLRIGTFRCYTSFGSSEVRSQSHCLDFGRIYSIAHKITGDYPPHFNTAVSPINLKVVSFFVDHEDTIRNLFQLYESQSMNPGSRHFSRSRETDARRLPGTPLPSSSFVPSLPRWC